MKENRAFISYSFLSRKKREKNKQTRFAWIFLKLQDKYAEVPQSSVSTHPFSIVSSSYRILQLSGYYDRKVVNRVNNTSALQD